MSERIVEITWQHNGRHVEPGTELSIRGERGRFKFVAHVLTDSGEWLDVWGGTDGQQAFRAFALDRVTTVHTKPKLRDAEMPRPSSRGNIR